MSFEIDESTDFGARVARRLREETVVWLTTVTPAGAPVPSPVWFWWLEPDAILMFSRAGTPRTRNIEADPRVALNFDGNGKGGDIVVLAGRAAIDPSPDAAAVEAYVDKYRTDFKRIGVTTEGFFERYPIAIRIALTRLRGH
jgi:PPOX class probable F420-dependent enzyme